MTGKVRSGFSSYLKSGEYTPDFIDDVNMMISKVFRRWTLYETADEFSAFCWTKIVNSLKIYDEQGGRETGPLSTYLYKVIMNEAVRLYSKHKKMASDDIDEMTNPSYWGPERGSLFSDGGSLELRDRVCSFAKMAYQCGVWVDQHKLFRNYSMGFQSPAVKAFIWFQLLGKDNRLSFSNV